MKGEIFAAGEWWVASGRRIYLVLTKSLSVPADAT